MKKLILALSLVVFLFGFVGCEKSLVETRSGNGGDGVLEGEEIVVKEIWLYESSDITIYVKLENYLLENKFYLSVVNPKKWAIPLGQDGTWQDYKIIDHKLDGRMMYIKKLNGEFPTEEDRYNKWFVL